MTLNPFVPGDWGGVFYLFDLNPAEVRARYHLVYSYLDVSPPALTSLDGQQPRHPVKMGGGVIKPGMKLYHLLNCALKES